MLVTDDVDHVKTNNFLCPSCGMMPNIQGPTVGCEDIEGCGLFHKEVECDENLEDEEEDADMEELNFD